MMCRFIKEDLTILPHTRREVSFTLFIKPTSPNCKSLRKIVKFAVGWEYPTDCYRWWDAPTLHICSISKILTHLHTDLAIHHIKDYTRTLDNSIFEYQFC